MLLVLLQLVREPDEGHVEDGVATDILLTDNSRTETISSRNS